MSQFNGNGANGVAVPYQPYVNGNGNGNGKSAGTKSHGRGGLATAGDGVRLPPQNREAEAAVLGSILIDPDAMMEVEDFLRPEMFYSVAHQWIFEAMLGLYRRNEPVDTLTLIEELRRWNRLEGVGSEAEIIGLVNDVPTSLNAYAYAKIVEECATRREMLRAAERIAGLAWDEEQELSGQLDQAEQIMFDVRARQVERQTHQPQTYAVSFLTELEGLCNNDDENALAGLSTGIPDLDAVIQGLEKKALYVWGGRPSMGKSTLGTQVAWHVAQNHHVFMWSGEMDTDQLMRRLVAAETGISSESLKSPQFLREMAPNQWAMVHTAVDKVGKSGLVIDTTASITPEQLRSACMRQQLRGGLDLLVVDHLHLVAQTGMDETAAIVRNIEFLRILAKDLDIPVIVLAQLSRGVEDRQEKRPIMRDLHGSTKIEANAYSIGFLYRDEYYNPDTTMEPGVAEFNVVKNRDGRLARIKLHFNDTIPVFRPLARGHAGW